MPALFLRAEGQGPAATVIHLQGFDSVKETQYPYLGGYRPRGLSALIVDQPGAGEALRLHGLKAQLDAEEYVSVLVDYLETRPDVDAARIGVAGLSMGGYLAPRAAAFEPRIKACVAWGALYDLGPLVRGMLQRVQGATAAPLPDAIEHALWTFGLESVEAWAEIAEKMTLRGVLQNLTCPLLVTHGENDRQVPLEQAQRTVDEAASANKQLKVFRAEDGGSEHCQLDNRYMGADYVTDWFRETLIGVP